MPGLLAVTPPRKTARGREHTTLVAYLAFGSNAPVSTAEVRQLINEAAWVFYQATGSLTFALRNTANDINAKLLSRNLSTAGQGQQVLGLLILAAIRENQCTLLLSGPAHAVWVTDGASRHIHDPALSGKGLGSGQSVSTYLSQVELHPQDLLVLCGVFPRDWEADLMNERPPASLDASYRKLTFTKGDLNAVLIQAQSGHYVAAREEQGSSAARRRSRERSCTGRGCTHNRRNSLCSRSGDGGRAVLRLHAADHRRRAGCPGRIWRAYDPAICLCHPATTGGCTFSTFARRDPIERGS
jgi:hypothetical protein